jgi:hypothetical protein
MGRFQPDRMSVVGCRAGFMMVSNKRQQIGMVRRARGDNIRQSVVFHEGTAFYGARISGGSATLRNRWSKSRKSINRMPVRKVFQYSFRELNLDRHRGSH